MTTKKTPALSSLFHRLDTLLHTMRCIAQYDDALCELSHEIKLSGLLTPEASEELHSILNKIPARDYVHDLESVNEALDRSTAPKKSASRAARKLNPPLSGKKVAERAGRAGGRRAE